MNFLFTTTAQRTTSYLEETHRLLSPQLKWEPATRTQVLLIDNADSANGLTAAVGRFGMVLYATPPDNWFSTYVYDDWLWLLCVHEYTHLLNLDSTTSFYPILRVLFGDVFLPNGLLHRWMLEGLAVYTETLYTRGGRGRSTFYDMISRAAVEENVLGASSFVTLDRMTGRTPWFPTGEMPYYFGYQLMNQVAKNSGGIKTLGEYSYRSSGRIPFFVNGNLENITGKTWHTTWDDWIRETRAHAEKQLSQIKAQPVTKFKFLTQSGTGSYGARVSPDGQWLAYSQTNSDEMPSLYLRNLKSGKTQKLEKKALGVGHSFTPDSKYLVFSALEQHRQYYSWSDLKAHDLATGKTRTLLSSHRARDPDISADGQWVTFTLTELGTTGLARARLYRHSKGLSLGAIEKLYFPKKYGRVSTPKFSPSAKEIIFSLHENEKPQEDLVSYSIDSRKLTLLISNGHFNRFPAFDPHQALTFVSDLTGVDNVYRLEGKNLTPLTNVTTGVWLHSFAPNGSLYASVFSTRGWDIAETLTPSLPSKTKLAALSPATAPTSEATAPKATETYSVHDYSIWPSILPRQWSPVLLVDEFTAYFGGMVSGFDATDRHRYILGTAYDTASRQPDLVGYYSNRQFGPTLSLLGQIRTQDQLYSGTTLVGYNRRLKTTASLSYPFRWTWESLTPSFSANLEKIKTYFVSSKGNRTLVYDEWFDRPSIDAEITYKQLESSSLAIATEGGRKTQAGVRSIFGTSRMIYRSLLTHDEYWKLWDHTILNPSVKASYATRNRWVDLSGRAPKLIDPLPSASLDELPIRGYPRQTFRLRSTVVTALDLQFPLARLFRGLGTTPIFFENLSGMMFGEATYLPSQELGPDVLGSAGGGLRFDTQLLLYLPITATVQYHQGFRLGAGGKKEVFFTLNLGQFDF